MERHDARRRPANAVPRPTARSVLLVDAYGLDYPDASPSRVPRGTIAARLNRARAVLRSALTATEGPA